MELESVLCARCGFRFDQNRLPKILSCGHTFCANCTQDSGAATIACFDCKKTVDTQKLPTNFAILREAERLDVPKDEDIDAQIDELLNKNVEEMKEKLSVKLAEARQQKERVAAALEEAEVRQRTLQREWSHTLDQRIKEVDTWCNNLLDNYEKELKQVQTQRQTAYNKALKEQQQALKDIATAIGSDTGATMSLESKLQLRRHCQNLLKDVKELDLHELPKLKASGTISLDYVEGTPSLTFTENKL